jgi:probable HAF family extracellular repeat protein
LGALGGNGGYSQAFAISSTGAVTGSSGSSSGSGHAFYWTGSSGMIDIGAPAGANAGVGVALNSLGHVVGYSFDHQPNGDSNYRGFLWSSAGGFQDLGAPSSSGATFPGGINSSDQVVGSYDTGLTTHAFLWSSATGFVDIATLPATDSDFLPGRINDTGMIVGDFEPARDVPWVYLVRWTAAGGTHELPNTSEDGGLGDLNDLGYIVGGRYWMNYPGATRAAIWDPTDQVMELPTPAGVLDSFASGINNLNQVAGWIDGPSFGSNRRAALWTGGGEAQDLNGLLDSSGAGWQLLSAVDINDSGQITGNGSFCSATSCVEHAYLLTPVPEPTMVWLLSGLMVIAQRRRRVW